MMQGDKSTAVPVIFSTLIVVSLIVGWSIPEFYEWTDSDQSRPSPLLWKVPLGAAIVSLAFCLALPWLPITIEQSSDVKETRMRFSMRTLLFLATFVVLVATMYPWLATIVSGCVSVAMLVCFVAFFVRHPKHRLAATTLIACMYLPYVWLLGFDELERLIPTLAVIFTAMPTFVPSLLIGSVLGQHFQESHWLAVLFTALEIAGGIEMIRLGPKCTIASLLLVLHLSALGSLVFLQLCLA